MGLFDGTQKTTTTGKTTSKDKLPGYINDASKYAVGTALSQFQDAQGKSVDDRVAGFVPDQKTAFQSIRDLNSGAPNVLPEALQGARNYAAAPAQNIDFWNVNDPNSPLGDMSGYMNPYGAAVLDPTLQKIYDAADQARKQLNAGATSAGAFGDARHGVEQSNLDLNTMRSVGETSGNLLKQMYDTMMGQRQTDLSRLFNTDQANAGYNETALNRQLTGSGAVLDRTAADQNQKLQRVAALLGSGGQQQAQNQETKNVDYGGDSEMLKQLTSIISGVPYERSSVGTSTATQTSPDNSLWQLAGTLAGAAFAPVTAGGSTAIGSIL